MNPITGNILDENGQIVNLVDLLGGGTPVSQTIHDLSMYAPRSGNIINGKGDVVNLVTLLGGGTPVDDRQYDLTQYMPASGLILGSDGKAYDLAALLSSFISGTPSVLLAEHTTLRGAYNERDRVWFARHMEPGTYALKITLSDVIGSLSDNSEVLTLKTASAFGDSGGTVLFRCLYNEAVDRTVFDASFTLTSATDGFFLFAKLLKVGIHIQLFTNGEVTDSSLLDIAPVATLQGSSASPGEGWFPVNLAAGAHTYKIEIGGASASSGTTVIVKVAAAEGDTSGKQLLSYTGAQCNGGLTVMDTLTLTEAVTYLYVVYKPSTQSTFTLTLTML